MNVLDRRLVEDVAARLESDPRLIEKDWHVTRAIGVLAALDREGAEPAFGGGTSLSKAWGLIRRFSEDIDFKVTMPAASRNRARRERGAYRERIVGALAAAGFEPMGEVVKRDENRFFSASFLFASSFTAGRGLRPHIRVEMSLAPPALPATRRPIGSLVAQAQGLPPEVTEFLAVNPVETAADKLSALAWRVQARRRGSVDDDPTIVRHLHDLAALRTTAATAQEFPRLVRDALKADTGRGGEAVVPADPATLFAGMLDRLGHDPLWAREYEEFVEAVSFAAPDDRIPFGVALAATRELVGLMGSTSSGAEET
jgi:Nucleotidyl transferase AbiEii toxin, Type IV TA system